MFAVKGLMCPKINKKPSIKILSVFWLIFKILTWTCMFN